MKERPVIYSRPASGTRTGRVWEVADRISLETGRRAARREVLQCIADEDGNLATANTQYQYWKTAYDAAEERSPTPQEHRKDIEEQQLKIGRDGRFVIPREMREAMMLEEGAPVTARIEAGELRLVSRKTAIQRMQADTRRLKRPGESVVDAFLDGRRTMWGED